jgi:hypothetical protein
VLKKLTATGIAAAGITGGILLAGPANAESIPVNRCSGACPQPGYQYSSPGYQNPGYQDPGYQNPGYQNPGYQDPSYQNPGYQNLGHQYPRYQNPGNRYGWGHYHPWKQYRSDDD